MSNLLILNAKLYAESQPADSQSCVKLLSFLQRLESVSEEPRPSAAYQIEMTMATYQNKRRYSDSAAYSNEIWVGGGGLSKIRNSSRGKLGHS